MIECLYSNWALNINSYYVGKHRELDSSGAQVGLGEGGEEGTWRETSSCTSETQSFQWGKKRCEEIGEVRVLDGSEIREWDERRRLLGHQHLNLRVSLRESYRPGSIQDPWTKIASLKLNPLPNSLQFNFHHQNPGRLRHCFFLFHCDRVLRRRRLV